MFDSNEDLNNNCYTDYDENEDYTKPEKVYIAPEMSESTYRKILAADISLAIFIGIMFGLILTYTFINFVSKETTLSFSAFLTVLSIIFMFKICKKHQEKVKIINMVLLAVSSLLFGICVFLTQYIKSSIIFWILFIIALVSAIITAYFFKNKTKRYFIPFLLLFVLLSLINASEQLFWFKNQIQFSAEYFYISSKQATYTNDKSNYYSKVLFSKENIDKISFSKPATVIKSADEMYDAFYNLNENNTNLIMDFNAQGIAEELANMISASNTKYDEKFFNENNLLVLSFGYFYYIQKNELENIAFKNDKLQISNNVYTKYEDYQERYENEYQNEFCMVLVAVNKSYSIPSFISSIQYNPNIIFTD